MHFDSHFKIILYPFLELLGIRIFEIKIGMDICTI